MVEQVNEFGDVLCDCKKGCLRVLAGGAATLRSLCWWTSKPVPRGSELLVYYGDDSARELTVHSETSGQSFRPVSGPELDLPDIIADLSSDQLLLYQHTRAVRTGNISAKEAWKKIGLLNQ
ncbi:hypothetical protein FJT64_021970 [Amphibalanus amphitrite]|uniref:SET domain-containing protein n=1 Tax=Amphibalanus amphitrite TaxID=1232801 RepID=A0A6A4WGL3_AMPAM|nr:hypothetical protein FJT64_021970 [Amphibalanus amphitrite]